MRRPKFRIIGLQFRLDLFLIGDVPKDDDELPGTPGANLRQANRRLERRTIISKMSPVEGEGAFFVRRCEILIHLIHRIDGAILLGGGPLRWRVPDQITALAAKHIQRALVAVGNDAMFQYHDRIGGRVKECAKFGGVPFHRQFVSPLLGDNESSNSAITGVPAKENSCDG